MALEKGQREALETIIRESERLQNLAKASGNPFLASLLGDALREARATLLGEGHELPPSEPSGPTVVPFKPR